jgi:hypothetical protein
MSSSLYEAIIDTFTYLGGTRTINEIKQYLWDKHGEDTWKDIGTTMADMVSIEYGGSSSSNVPQHFRVLKRVSRGVYSLM